jgi:pimeloyl-ACP methyl ester carboxylesterase
MSATGTTTPGTNAPFGALKQVDAGPLSYNGLEHQLADSPVITVPTITFEGDANGAPHPDPGTYAAKFTGKYAHRAISGGVGHNLPQEAPQAFAQAVVDVDRY